MTEWYKKNQMQTNRIKILEALNRENLTFGELLTKAPMSRATLTAHLKTLQRENAVQKIYDEEKERVTYQISSKSQAELQVEGMIRYLGVVAAHQIVRQLLNKPNPIKLEEELNSYLRALEKSEDGFRKQLFDYLEKNHPQVI